MDHKTHIADVVNGDGEIINHLYDGDRILRHKSAEMLNGQKLWLPDEPFVKLLRSAQTKLQTDLKPVEYKFFYYLTVFVRYGSGLLAHDNGREVTVDWLAENAKVDVRTIYRLLSALRDKKVIGTFKTGGTVQIFMNPYICFVGRYINDTLYEMFVNSAWAKLYKAEQKKQRKQHRVHPLHG